MADEEDFVEDVQQDLEISRGLRPEINIDLSKVEDLFVYNSHGNQVRFGDLYRNRKTIVIFVRHFLCFICKEYVDDLSLIPEKHLREADVNVVVIGCAPFKFIQPFREVTNYKYGLFVDPDREIYKKLGLLEKLKAGNVKESRHVKSGMFMGVLKSTWRGMKYRELQGDVNQQGGAFVVGPGNVVHFYHFDQNTTDHCRINSLLSEAGVQPVSFAKDKPVITI